MVARLCAVAMLVFCCCSTATADPATIEDIGVDAAATASAVGTALGSIIGVLLPIAGALLVIRRGVQWMRDLVACVLAVSISGAAMATDPVTLHPMLVADVGAMAGSVASQVASLIGVVLSIFAAFWLVRLGLQWLRVMMEASRIRREDAEYDFEGYDRYMEQSWEFDRDRDEPLGYHGPGFGPRIY